MSIADQDIDGRQQEVLDQGVQVGPVRGHREEEEGTKEEMAVEISVEAGGLDCPVAQEGIELIDNPVNDAEEVVEVPPSSHLLDQQVQVELEKHR